MFDLHHKTNNRDRPTRPFYVSIRKSLYRVVRYLFSSLYVSFLFLFVVLLLLLRPIIPLPLSYDRGINTTYIVESILNLIRTQPLVVFHVVSNLSITLNETRPHLSRRPSIFSHVPPYFYSLVQYNCTAIIK